MVYRNLFLSTAARLSARSRDALSVSCYNQRKEGERAEGRNGVRTEEREEKEEERE
jgi:hypothetical protein